MSNPRPLVANATADHLHDWIIEWAARYDVASDRDLIPISTPLSGYFGVDELEVIYRWKLGKRWQGNALKRLHKFAQNEPGQIQTSTGLALAAANDTTAFKSLSAIPGMKSGDSVALRSAVLMVGNPTRWSVIDRMANASLVHLRDTLAMQVPNPAAPLREVAIALSAFQPKADKNGGYPAGAKDRAAYMECVRMMSKHTWLSLRTIDRALYMSRGR